MNKIWGSLGLAVLGIAILVGAATAETTGTTTLSGTNPLVYSITAPTSVAFGTFTAGATANTVVTDGTTYAHLGLTTNGPVSLQSYESGASSSETNDGFMHITETNTHLASKLQVKADSGSLANVGASSSFPVTFAPAQTSGDKVLTFSQLVSSSDTAGTYEITVTFAVSSS